MNNTYPLKGWQVKINNWQAWSNFKKFGFCDPANQI